MSSPASDTFICDNGTGYIKAGHRKQERPEFTYPSCVGRPCIRFEQDIDDNVINSLKSDILVGDQTVPLRQYLDLSYPISNGIINNWGDMEKIWHYTFEKLGAKDADCTGKHLVLTEAARNPMKNRVDMYNEMFETFNFSHAKIETQAVLTLYSVGKYTGVVVDSGDGVTHIVPVYEGCIFEPQVKRLDIAGRKITEHLRELLNRRGYAFNSSSDFDFLKDIKQRYCYVALDYKEDLRLARETTALNTEFELPDKSKIRGHIAEERFMAPEIMFNPSLVGMEADGVGYATYKAINEAPMNCRKELFNAILLSGGTAMFNGFRQRLTSEISKNYYNFTLYKKHPYDEITSPEENKNKDSSLEASFERFKKSGINVETPLNAYYCVFAGASLISEIYDLEPDKVYITRKFWMEEGANRVGKIVSMQTKN